MKRPLRQSNINWELSVMFITTALLIIAREMSGFHILLLDRFWSGAGYIQIAVAAIASVAIYRKLQDKSSYTATRRILWVAFGIWFFAQFALGIFFEQFLLTGELHFPIPFIIEAGAIYRNHIGFMVVLFAVSVIVSGSAWCSHLCYFGCFDLAACKKNSHTSPLKITRTIQWGIRIAILISVSIIAWMMRICDITTNVIVVSVVVVWILEIAIITLLSRRKGKMIHCTIFCPLGTIVAITKYVNPRRVVFTDNCNACGACAKVCRYSAINGQDIGNRKVSTLCVMCGDCVAKCPKGGIKHKFLNLSPDNSLRLTMAIIAILYTLFFVIAMV